MGKVKSIRGYVCLTRSPRFKGEKMGEEVTPHQRVAAASENIESGASGDHKPIVVSVRIVYSFENVFPFGPFVNLVETDPAMF